MLTRSAIFRRGLGLGLGLTVRDKLVIYFPVLAGFKTAEQHELGLELLSKGFAPKVPWPQNSTS